MSRDLKIPSQLDAHEEKYGIYRKLIGDSTVEL